LLGGVSVIMPATMTCVLRDGPSGLLSMRRFFDLESQDFLMLRRAGASRAVSKHALTALQAALR